METKKLDRWAPFIVNSTGEAISVSDNPDYIKNLLIIAAIITVPSCALVAYKATNLFFIYFAYFLVGLSFVRALFFWKRKRVTTFDIKYQLIQIESNSVWGKHTKTYPFNDLNELILCIKSKKGIVTFRPEMGFHQVRRRVPMVYVFGWNKESVQDLLIELCLILKRDFSERSYWGY